MSIVTNVTQILFSVHCNIHQHQYQYLKSDESQKCRYSCALSLFIIDKQKITHRLYVFNVVFLSFGPLSLFWFRLIFLYHAVIACPIPISDNLLSNVSCFSARWLVATMVTRARFFPGPSVVYSHWLIYWSICSYSLNTVMDIKTQ